VLDVVDVLEILGADADLVHAPPASLDSILHREGLQPAVRSALLEGDESALHALLRAPNSVCCLINPAEPEEEEDEEELEEGEDDGDDEEEEHREGPQRRG
jgi:hypothetical protein